MSELPQESFPHREPNPDVAHTVANSLNQLIDVGVLQSSQVSQAANETFTEFIVRYHDQIRNNDFLPELHPKLVTLFNQNEAETVPESPDEIRGGQVADLMLQVYEKYHETDSELQGFILFGSRLDPDKHPRPDSDIDVMAVFMSNDAWKLQNTAPIHHQMEQTKQELFPEVKARLGRSSIEHGGQFYDLLKNQDIWEVPDWGWKPQAVRYVGRLDVPDYFADSGEEEAYTEDQVNDMIQNLLTSPAMEQKKAETIEEIKQQLTI